MTLGGCSSVPLTETGAISSYSGLGPTSGTFGKWRSYVRGEVLEARTIKIIPTRMTPQARAVLKVASDQKLVTNAVDRSLCLALSDRFVVVPESAPADLTVQATVSTIVPTGSVAAGVSKVMTLGTAAVLPVGVPRLPIGLGGIAVEAEATNASGTQVAAITWARGANSLTSNARVSEIGDAYGLASSFGNQFGRMVVSGKDNPGIALPSARRIGSAAGLPPKYRACDAFGRSSGLAGLAGSVVGAPPSWTDNGADP
nr:MULTISPECIES: DUF3313 domain-containing protein [unclassified Rhizobium]